MPVSRKLRLVCYADAATGVGVSAVRLRVFANSFYVNAGPDCRLVVLSPADSLLPADSVEDVRNAGGTVSVCRAAAGLPRLAAEARAVCEYLADPHLPASQPSLWLDCEASLIQGPPGDLLSASQLTAATTGLPAEADALQAASAYAWRDVSSVSRRPARGDGDGNAAGNFVLHHAVGGPIHLLVPFLASVALASAADPSLPKRGCADACLWPGLRGRPVHLQPPAVSWLADGRTYAHNRTMPDGNGRLLPTAGQTPFAIVADWMKAASARKVLREYGGRSKLSPRTWG